MQISILANQNKDTDGKVLNAVLSALEGKAQMSVFYERVDGQVFQGADMAVVLGGDGTIIRAAKCAAVYGVPVCGINLGKVGFLASMEVGEIETSMKRILTGDFKIEKRMMLSLHLHTKSGRTRDILALNDVEVGRGAYPKMIEIHMEANHEFLDTYMADGVIVSTPTGSTAYALSAGGPVVEPTTELFLVTPICAFDLHTRSMVLSANKQLSVVLGGRQDCEGTMSVDGIEEMPIHCGDQISIVKSDSYVQLVNMGERSFYSVLRKKLGRR